jgi:acetyl esterase/lipase
MLSREIEEYASLPALLFRAARSNLRYDPRITERRIRFGPNARQYLIALDPPASAPARNSAVLFIHGGGWSKGEASYFRFIGRFFARLGYRTVVAGYRLAPRFRFPAQSRDVHCALTWMLRQDSWPGSAPRRVIAVGQSAGAQLAALMVYDRAELERRGLAQGLFAGLVSISGPLDFSACHGRRGRKLVTDYMGEYDLWPAADPIRYVTGSERIPLLCLHGERDPTVELESCLSFARRLEEAQAGLARVVVMKGALHSNVTELFLDDLPETRALEAWLEEQDCALPVSPHA